MNGQKPVALLFAREIDKDLTGLVKAVDGAVAGKKDTGAVFVLLDKDRAGAKEKLKKLQAETGATIPLTVSETGEKSPDGYEINPKAKATVVLYKGKKVVQSIALEKLAEAEVKLVLEATRKNFGG